MHTLLLATCGVLLASLCVQAVEELPCVCPCGKSKTFSCACDCDAPKTVCYPGFTKICPEKYTGCPAGDVTVCRKEAKAAAQLLAASRLGEEPAPAARASPVEESVVYTTTMDKINCGKGLPSFSCDFSFSYLPRGEVTKFKANSCTHRRPFDKCPVTFGPLEEGCNVTALISNKQAKVEAVGKIRMECPEDPNATPAPTTAPTTLQPYSHAGDNVTVIGDGCVCIPDFLIPPSLTSLPSSRAKKPSSQPSKPTKPGKGKPNKIPGCKPGKNQTRFGKPDCVDWVKNTVPMEVQCKGVPKFDCTFRFQTDEFCERTGEFSATGCTHRKDVIQCPVTLTSELGCQVDVLITNKGAKMLVSDKTEVSGGPQRTLGFMESCVCIVPAA